MTKRLGVPPLGRPLRLHDLRGRERRRAEVEDLAGPLQVGERVERLLDLGVGRGAVDLVQVDVVGLQPAQARLDLAHQPAPAVAALVGVLAHRPVRLGRQHDVLAAALQGLADDLLGLPRRVHVGGVDDVDPGVERRVDDPDGVVVVGVAPRAEHHRAERERADLDAGTAERAHLHAAQPAPCLGQRRARYPSQASRRSRRASSSSRSCRSMTSVVRACRTAATTAAAPRCARPTATGPAPGRSPPAAPGCRPARPACRVRSRTRPAARRRASRRTRWP